MDPDKDNANPTILNASDLPTRRAFSTSKPRLDGGTGLFDGLLPDTSSLDDPFNIYQDSLSSASCDSPSVSSDPDSGSPRPRRVGGEEVAREAGREGEEREEIDTQELYDLLAPISDPEHPLSLGSLSVINLRDIHITPPPPSSKSPSSNPTSRSNPGISTVTVLITPTITHCSLATVIGLGVRVRLERALPPRFRVDVRVKEGTHSTGEQVSKQLADKERVAAALENGTLRGVVERMLGTCA